MSKPITGGALVAVALILTLPATSQAHISPTGLDTNTGAPGIQLPAGTNLVMCANHAASTLHLVNESDPRRARPTAPTSSPAASAARTSSTPACTGWADSTAAPFPRRPA